MGLKKFNAKKEIKKLKRRSNKLKRVGVIGALIGTIFIVSSYSLYSYTKSSLVFNSTINKRVKTTVNVTNGSGGETKEGDYKVSQTFTITPNDGYVYGSVSCTNSAQASYNANTKILTISNQTKDTTCTVKFDETLKHGIIANNTLKSGTPDYSKGEPLTSGSNTGSGLYKANDDQGESYYFRGDKTQLKNNVKFANQNWKIVRINGDGTIRLILSDNSFSSINSIGTYKFNDYTSNSSTPQHNMVGYTYNNTTSCTKNNPCEVNFYPVATPSTTAFINTHGGKNSDIKTELEEWYYNNLKGYDNKIAYGYFCNDTSSSRYTYSASSTSTVYYGAYERIKNSTSPQPSLKCPDPKDNKGTTRPYGGIYKTKIGLITADEMNMAGLSLNEPNADETNYLYSDYLIWSMSPRHSSNVAYLFAIEQGSIGNYYAHASVPAVVPVINLNSNVTATGDGSTSNPFVIQ